MPKAQLLCFAKAPEHGKVKTRLAQGTSADTAFAIYQELLKRTAAVVDAWSHDKHIFYTGDLAVFKQCPLGIYEHSGQINGGLGERLLAAATARIDKGPMIFIGTDCPEIAVDKIQEIETQLETHDVCIAPSNDGGYWAIGLHNLKQAEICFASDLPWSREELSEKTIKRLDEADISHCLGPQLFDLDDIEDLKLAQSGGFPTFSQA